jgi:hypothetical protein
VVAKSLVPLWGIALITRSHVSELHTVAAWTSHRRGLGIIAILAHGTLTLEGFVIRYIISWRVFDGSNDTDLQAFRVLSRLQFRRSLLFCVPGRLFFTASFSLPVPLNICRPSKSVMRRNSAPSTRRYATASVSVAFNSAD